MLILGDNEEESGMISVRDREEREEKEVSLQRFKEALHEEVEEKKLQPDFLD
jgi:threonyl-tRNA synthetase